MQAIKSSKGHVRQLVVGDTHGCKGISCYAGRTFALANHRVTVCTDGTELDVFDSTLKGGRAVRLAFFPGTGWNVKRDGCFKSYWLPNVEELS
jgi:hypothetical protein